METEKTRLQKWFHDLRENSMETLNISELCENMYCLDLLELNLVWVVVLKHVLSLKLSQKYLLINY